MPLYIKETQISPLYVVRRMPLYIKETQMSPLYNGEVNASVYKRDSNVAVVQWRGECLGI